MSATCGVANALRKSPSALGFAVGTEIFEVDGAILLPNRFARFLVERDDELRVAAIEIHDQQVAVEDRRRAGAAVMVALDVAPFPQHLAALRIETGRAR